MRSSTLVALPVAELLLGALVGCSRQDVDHTKRQLHEVGQEAKQTAHKAAEELKKDAHEASRKIAVHRWLSGRIAWAAAAS